MMRRPSLLTSLLLVLPAPVPVPTEKDQKLHLPGVQPLAGASACSKFSGRWFGVCPDRELECV